MTKKIKDGGPAYPHGNREVGGHPGKSLRDEFAGQALQGLLAFGAEDLVPHNEKSWERYIAKEAYGYADAMIEARERENTESRLNVDLQSGDIRTGVEYYNRIDASVYSVAGQYNNGSFQLTRGDGIQRKATGSELEDKKRWLRIIPTKESV